MCLQMPQKENMNVLPRIPILGYSVDILESFANQFNTSVCSIILAPLCGMPITLLILFFFSLLIEQENHKIPWI